MIFGKISRTNWMMALAKESAGCVPYWISAKCCSQDAVRGDIFESMVDLVDEGLSFFSGQQRFLFAFDIANHDELFGPLMPRDHWIFKCCGYWPQDKMRDYLVVIHRQPNLRTLELMIALCAAYHAFVRRLGTLCTLASPECAPDFR